MKHVYLYTISILSLAFFFACTPEKPTDEEILNSRPVTDLTVSYAMDGAALTTLSFSHFAGTKTIDVQLNDENLVWNLVSNRDWCQVISPAGKGSGTAVIKVSANDGFDARDNATLTFVAGDFRGFQLPVAQRASLFILSQPYFLSGRNGADVDLQVTMPAGTDWDFTSDAFLTVTRGDVIANGEMNTATLNIRAERNDAASRMGVVRLVSGEEVEPIYLYQLGTEYNYDAEGNICFPGSESTLILVVPEFAFGEMKLPARHVSYEKSEAVDGFVTLSVKLDENLNDTAEKREIAASLLLSNAAASVVDLPLMLQDFLPAYGLVTSNGLLAFAAAVEEGASTEAWETDGEVCLKDDIDMEGVADWKGIGSEAHPFSARFNGNGFSILNLNGDCGLFNYCKDATVKNVSIGKGVELVRKTEPGGKNCFGSIVSVAEGTSVENCSFAGNLVYSCPGATLYVGGIVGWADDGSSILKSKVTGNVKVSTASGTTSVCYLGGIAGLSEGTISEAEVLGAVTFSSGIATVYAGGVQAALVDGAVVSDNSFMGTLSLDGTASLSAVGGLYGLIDSDRVFDKAADASVSLGKIAFNSCRSAATTCVYLGGFAGLVTGGTSLAFKGYETQTNITMDFTKLITAKYVCAGGFLGGCDVNEAAKSLQFEGLSSSGIIEGKYATTIACNVRRNWLGGIAGYVNGPSVFSSCSNRGEVGKDVLNAVYCAKSNGYGEICGGIAGYVHGGDASFTNCMNQADISEHLYNNNAMEGLFDGIWTPPVVGGILGAFNYRQSFENYQLTMTACTNTRNIFGYRGYNGGIVGYCCNATLTGCNNTGRLGNGANDQSAYRGGIAGCAGNATIQNCTALCDVVALVYGSANWGSAGGILGMATGEEPVNIQGCDFYGAVSADKKSTDKPEYPGGIVGKGTEDTHISDCRLGGSVQSIEISANNVDSPDIVIGNALGTISGISYWTGK